MRVNLQHIQELVCEVYTCLKKFEIVVLNPSDLPDLIYKSKYTFDEIDEFEQQLQDIEALVTVLSHTLQ